jgi:hypothetical protein
VERKKSGKEIERKEKVGGSGIPFIRFSGVSTPTPSSEKYSHGQTTA